MSKDQELTLFGDLDNFTTWKKEWQNMPEFIQEDLEPWRAIEVSFNNYFKKDGTFIKERIIKVSFEDLEAVREFAFQQI